MKKHNSELNVGKRLRNGLSLVELMVTIAISVIPISTIGVLLVSGQHAWNKTYSSAHKKIKDDAKTVTAVFGSIGRKSDRRNCGIYASGADTTEISVSQPGDGIARGLAVEFRYWGKEDPRRGRRFNPAASETSTSSSFPGKYARFYLDADNKLKVDYGPYPYNLGKRRVANTVVLAENVSELQFSRTTLNGVGQGCVRVEMTLTDPLSRETITLKAATLMRN